MFKHTSDTCTKFIAAQSNNNMSSVTSESTTNATIEPSTSRLCDCPPSKFKLAKKIKMVCIIYNNDFTFIIL